MTDTEAQQLYDACIEMANAMGIVFPEGDGLVPFEDPRLEAIEHATHELAHAILLDVPLLASASEQHSLYGNPRNSLSDRIGMNIPAHRDEANRNEALCFVVERAVFKHMGIECEDAALRDALWIQVSNDDEALDLFDSGELHEEAREAVRRIPLIYDTYKERVR